MPDGFKVTLDIPDFRRQLREVEKRFRRRAVSQGVRDAAKVFRAAARQAAPVLRTRNPRRLPGALRTAITIARSRNATRGSVAYSVIVRASRGRRGTARDPFYWRFLEGGWIPRGPGQRIAGGTVRKRAERERLAAARVSYPFLGPAFQRMQGAAIAAFSRGVERRLAEVQGVK